MSFQPLFSEGSSIESPRDGVKYTGPSGCSDNIGGDDAMKRSSQRSSVVEEFEELAGKTAELDFYYGIGKLCIVICSLLETGHQNVDLFSYLISA